MVLPANWSGTSPLLAFWGYCFQEQDGHFGVKILQGLHPKKGDQGHSSKSKHTFWIMTYLEFSGSSIRALWWLAAFLDMKHLAMMNISKLPLSSTAYPTATRRPTRRPPRLRLFVAATSRPSAWTRFATWPGPAMPREGPKALTHPSGQHQSSMNTSNVTTQLTIVQFLRAAIRITL